MFLKIQFQEMFLKTPFLFLKTHPDPPHPPVPVATAFGGDAWPTYGELRGLLGVVAPIAQTSARWYVTWHEGWGVTARIR